MLTHSSSCKYMTPFLIELLKSASAMAEEKKNGVIISTLKIDR